MIPEYGGGEYYVLGMLVLSNRGTRMGGKVGGWKHRSSNCVQQCANGIAQRLLEREVFDSNSVVQEEMLI
ncbi:hypothetical protein Btru_017814 [Bulinus truncatus]|nr:hypothetical protein Btru_017814 [Bulinus truncatus]